MYWLQQPLNLLCHRFFGPNNFKRIVLVSVEYLEQIIIVPYLITSLWTRFSDPAAKKRTWATPTAIDKFKWIFVISDLITLGKQQNLKVLEHSSFCFVITFFTCLSFYLSVCLFVCGLVRLFFFFFRRENKIFGFGQETLNSHQILKNRMKLYLPR